MVEVSAEVIGQWLGSYLWPLFRIASFFMVIPVISTQLIPMRVRLGLAILMTILIAPLLDDVPQVDALSPAAIVITLQQILIGAAMGFAAFMLFQIFVVAGQMIAMQMGLGFASMVDPSNGVNVPILSQFYLAAVTLMYLAMNGHLVLFEVFIESFNTIPIATDGLAISTLWELVNRISWLFASAMLLALPAMAAVLIIYISFGVMTRAAPQMNIFAIGFPISLLFGLFANWVLFRDLFPHFQRLSEETFLFLRAMQGA
ncbi:MAG: flagellar type III secretion system protein FliR [Halomonadaceae bacterium]|nr:MAG: flagellar type III secretion system protein FliR [Halomonadaceae bacterium]